MAFLPLNWRLYMHYNKSARQIFVDTSKKCNSHKNELHTGISTRNSQCKKVIQYIVQRWKSCTHNFLTFIWFGSG